MQFTKNYKLKKPELNEYALVTDLNENADVIDAELLKIGNSQTEVKQQLTTHLADDARHNSYGTSSTAATTAAKVVTRSGFKLVTGAHIAVKFTNANTAASPTLNVNSTGAKPIYQSGTTGATWTAGEIVEFVYDGANWCAFPTVKNLNDIMAAHLLQTNPHNITSQMINVINEMPVTAFMPEYPIGYSVFFVPANSNYSTDWEVLLGLDPPTNHYLMVEVLKTNSNNGFQRITAYRLGAANLPLSVFVRNSLGSTSWASPRKTLSSDDISNEVNVGDSTKIASSKAVKEVNDALIAHTAEIMPHKFFDNGKWYKWGFRTVNGEGEFIYEEVL